MELEEGTADYASWTILHDEGLATRDQLLARYGAQRAEVLHVTPAMQLDAASLMDPGGVESISRYIAESATTRRWINRSGVHPRPGVPLCGVTDGSGPCPSTIAGRRKHSVAASARLSSGP